MKFLGIYWTWRMFIYGPKAFVRYHWNATILKKVAFDPSLYEKRHKICCNCPFYEADSNQCTQCGCWLKWKLPIPWEYCPKFLW